MADRVSYGLNVSERSRCDMKPDRNRTQGELNHTKYDEINKPHHGDFSVPSAKPSSSAPGGWLGK